MANKWQVYRESWPTFSPNTPYHYKSHALDTFGRLRRRRDGKHCGGVWMYQQINHSTVCGINRINPWNPRLRLSSNSG
uniref:Uncharacterized protein n=1 Tax=Anopheles minimus TaxID=112268 RepID=A0A182WH25_9DIPT